MTPKEKAEELFDKYFFELQMPSDCEWYMQCVDRCGNMVFVAKKYAILAVDEIIDAIDWHKFEVPNDQLNYWFEVKEEINNL